MLRESLVRYLRWVINGALLTLCCFFLARTVNGVLAALLVPPPAPVGATAATPPPRKPSSWSDREAIVARNLFNASLLAPTQPPPLPREEVEPTELPLGLLGTISSAASPDRGWAAIWDDENRQRLVVEPGDGVGNGRATVLRIERERLLLSENGVVRELVFDENGEYRPPKRPRRTARPAADARARRGRRARR